MHQDINTFSDVLDIKTPDQLQVRLVVVAHGNIHYRMRLNGHLIAELDTTHTFDLLSSVHLKCRVIEPRGGAVEIKSLTVNGTEVLPRYQHLASPPTAWIDQEGTWHFDIPGAFYPWFHAISGQGWVA